MHPGPTLRSLAATAAGPLAPDHTLFAAGAVVLVGLLAVSHDASAQLRLQPYASGFSQPVGFVQDPTDPTVHLVIEQPGRIRVLRNDVVLATDFLDLRGVVSCCGERGLLGFAFAPDYATSGRFFVDFTNAAGDTVVARYKRSASNPLRADPAARFDLRWASIGSLPYIPHPFEYGNHNGGNLVFGPDGDLYVGTGDGGSANDPNNWAQNLGSLLGKILRIDVNVPEGDPQGYRVPADNPLASGTPPALPEIWDCGLRNPWRFSFDDIRGGTRALVIADVGQSRQEEIDYEPAGRFPSSGGNDYGWRIREGALPNIAGSAPLPLVDPIFEYDHPVGFSITGGFVYRGSGLSPSLVGRYVFADFVAGRIWSLGLSVDAATGAAAATDLIEHTGELGGSGAVGSISSFGRDADGELYVVQYSGTIRKLVAPTTPLRFLAAAAFSGAGRGDLLSQSTGGNVTLALDQAPVFNNVQRLYDSASTWRVVGAADVDHDGHVDVVWQGPTGSVIAWLMPNLSSQRTMVMYPGSSSWRVAAVVDLNRDGDPDLIWQSPTGQVVVWLMRNGALAAARSLWAQVSAWRVVGAGDFSGDGDPDLLWQGPTGALVVWAMHGTAVASAQPAFSGQSDWRVIGAGDLDGDSRTDLFWQSPTGQVVVWFVTATAPAGLVHTDRYLNRFGTQWELAVAPQPGG